MRRLIIILSGLLLTAGVAFCGNKTEGSCGKGVKWKLDEATGVLTIYGQGEMKDYGIYPDAKHSPWYGSVDIKKIIVEEGVTHIGKYAFANWKVQTISIPSSVQTLSYQSFYRCHKLTAFEVSPNNPNYCSFDGVLYTKDMSSLILYPIDKPGEIYTFPASVKSIGYEALYITTNLRKVALCPALSKIGASAFKCCKALKEIYYPEGIAMEGLETTANLVAYDGNNYPKYYAIYLRNRGLNEPQTSVENKNHSIDNQATASKPKVKSADAMKVAILAPIDKENKVSYAPKLMLRSYLTKAVTESEGYVGFDRVDLESIMSEQAFQRTGMVSDDQIKKLGEMTGAQYILMSEAVMVDENTMYITAKLIDVESARTEKVDYQLMGSSPEAIQKGCVAMAENLLK